ncbi:MAG: sigma-70 family RNA polymerase sigma factor [Anaerolineales bacterium]|nr:MAG: sigma-70 family RNA polymerase sigma factor [Anaerolineales bacterium]
MENPSDRSLVLRTKRGELEAYGDLVRRYQGSVFNVCYRMLGDPHDAEDLTQETFIRVHSRLDSFDCDRPFIPWVRRIAVNLCLNYINRNRRYVLPLNDEFEPSVSRERSPERAQEDHERNASLRQAICLLPAHYRAVIELRHFQELSYLEISKVLNIPLSDVKSHLFRARKSLAQRLSTDV